MTTNGYDLDEYDLTRLRSEKLIAQHTKPEPKPKPALRFRLDTHIHPERKQLEDFVLRQITTLLGKALKDYNDYLIEEMAKIIVSLNDEFEDKLDLMKSKHASDIAELQREIQELKSKSKRGPRGPRGAKGDKGTAPALHSWSIDAERFRVTGFFTDGTSTPHLDLRPLFENYYHQTSYNNG
jgi:uncharacterized protein YeeX (DUF496 family)